MTRLVRRLWRRLCETLVSSRRDEEFKDEVDAHIRMLTEDNIRSGMPRDAARRAAVLRFGNVESTKDEWRDQRRWPLMETIMRDTRFAFRGLVKEPGFATVCVLSPLASV